ADLAHADLSYPGLAQPQRLVDLTHHDDPFRAVGEGDGGRRERAEDIDHGDRAGRAPRAFEQAVDRDVGSAHAAQRFLKGGFRLATNAAIRSFWSSVAKVEWKRRRSKRTPSERVVSKARLTDSLTIIAIGRDISAMRVATPIASSNSLSGGTTRATS